MPPALAEALDSDPEAKATFEGLAFTHRKEFARWIDEAKREDTRARRVTQARGDDPHRPDPQLMRPSADRP